MIGPWEHPEQCCVLIKAKETHTHSNKICEEIMNLLETFTVVIRGTEHNNCDICEHRDDYKKTGQCVNRRDWNSLKQNQDILENLF